MRRRPCGIPLACAGSSPTTGRLVLLRGRASRRGAGRRERASPTLRRDRRGRPGRRSSPNHTAWAWWGPYTGGMTPPIVVTPTAGSRVSAPAPIIERVFDSASFVHLDVRSNFSLKDGAFFPEELAVRAAELGMPAVALTDRDGLYGAARFVDQCVKVGVKPILGATLTLASG